MLMIHVCCADCLARTLRGLRARTGAGLEARGFFYNPNIHPLLEFRRRLKSVKVFLERDPVPVEFEEEYGLVGFCAAVHRNYDPPARCRKCYDLRLGATAARAAATGCAAFTTTLVTSRHQDHALIRAAGAAAAAAHGVEFLYRDLREAEAPARLLGGLYRQQYCGCVFSEAERYGPTSRHLYRGAGTVGAPAAETTRGA